MVLVVGLDLAGVGIEPEHRAAVEIVAGVIGARPGRGVSGTPVDRPGVLVVGPGHPGGSAAGIQVIAAPGVMAGLAFARDRKGPPQLLAVIGVERDDIAANAEFAARAADDNL